MQLGGKLQHAHDEAKIEAEEKATVVQQLQACDAERKHLKEQVHQLTGSSADSSLSITHLESVLSRVLQTLKQREAQPVQMPAVAAGSILSTPADSMQQNLQKAQQIAREAEACEPCTAEFINLTTKVHKLTEPTPRYKEQLAAVERHSNNINAAAQQLTPKLSQAIKLCEQLIEKVKILIQSQQVMSDAQQDIAKLRHELQSEKDAHAKICALVKDLFCRF